MTDQKTPDASIASLLSGGLAAEQKYVCDECAGIFLKAQLATYRGTKIHCPNCITTGTVWTIKKAANVE